MNVAPPTSTHDVTHVRILDVGAMTADLPLNRERVAQLAHEAGRLGYHAARIDVDGITVVIHARFAPAIFIASHGLTAKRDLPLRPELMGLRTGETAQPFAV